MDFTKRSHLGSLIAAVLVGTLSLAINQVFKSNPEAVAVLLRRLQRPATAASADAGSSPVQIVALMKAREQLLAKMYLNWTVDEIMKTSRVQAICQTTQRDLAAINGLSEATDDQLREASMVALSVYFMGAEMMRAEFTELFSRLSRELLDSELGDAQTPQIKLLAAYHGLDVRQSDGRSLLSGLKEFSQTHADSDLCVKLYLLVAEDLVRQKRRPLARAVLSQGKAIYREKPAAQQLINRLIDLQAQDISLGRHPTSP